MSEFRTPVDWIDALETARLIKMGEISIREVMEQTVARIEAVDPTLNFMVDRVKEIERKIDALPAQTGAFHGVPYLIKDLGGRWPGLRSTSGCALFKDNIADHADLCSQRAVDAGFVPIGMTTAPELGWGYNTDSLLNGTTVNPWNPEYIAGGSSGGAAAAVAARVVPIAHATDGGGSIRVPAAWNGLVGLKPSRGRIPQGPDSADGLYGYITDGCVSITVRDTAAYLDAVAGNLYGDIYTPASPEGGFLAALDRPVRRLRIAVVTEAPSGVEVWEEALAAVEAAAELCADLGHDLVRARYNYDYESLYFSATKRLSAIAQGESVKQMEAALGRSAGPDELNDFILDSVRLAQQTSAYEHADDIAMIRRVSREIASQMADYDVVISPVTTCATPKVGEIRMFGPDYDFDSYHESIGNIGSFTFPMNCSGQPAISLPLHWSTVGLPVGVQFAGRYADEATLLNLAGQLELRAPWKDKRPIISAG